VRHGTRGTGLRGWPESSPSGGADSAQMWERDEGMSKGPASRIRRDQLQTLGELTLRHARDASAALGFTES